MQFAYAKRNNASAQKKFSYKKTERERESNVHTAQRFKTQCSKIFMGALKSGAILQPLCHLKRLVHIFSIILWRVSARTLNKILGYTAAIKSRE
jgi:hypothetical protein